MAIWGGIFNQSYYMAPAPGSSDFGSLYRHVNCFDQAAWLELTCSLLNATSWLAQQPFGFIKETYLVGIPNKVNNPFFGTDATRILVDNNDLKRTFFGCHVYVGNSKPFDSTDDAIYDGCAGPHLGTETAADYVTNSIQNTNETALYVNTYPGTINNIQPGDGVTGIDGQYFRTGGPNSSTSFSSTLTFQSPSSAQAVLNRLAPTSQPASVRRITHEDWANASSWVPTVLGEGWTTLFSQIVAAGESSTRAFWHIAGPDGIVLRITVITESPVTTGHRHPRSCASCCRCARSRKRAHRKYRAGSRDIVDGVQRAG